MYIPFAHQVFKAQWVLHLFEDQIYKRHHSDQSSNFKHRMALKSQGFKAFLWLIDLQSIVVSPL